MSTIARALDKMIVLATLYTDEANPNAKQQYGAELQAHMGVCCIILKNHKEYREAKNKKRRDKSKQK